MGISRTFVRALINHGSFLSLHSVFFVVVVVVVNIQRLLKKNIMVLAETQQTKFNWPFSPIRDETQMTPYGKDNTRNRRISDTSVWSRGEHSNGSPLPIVEIFDLDPKEWNQERSQKYLRGTILRIYDAFKVSHEKLSAFMRRETIEAEFHISLFDSPQLRDIRREDVRRIVLGAVNGAMVLMERALKWVEDASFNQWHDPADGTKKCWIVLPGERDILYRFYTRKLGRKLVHWPRPGNKCAYVTVNPVNLGASAKETGVPKEDSWPFDDPSGTTKMSAYGRYSPITTNDMTSYRTSHWFFP